VKREKNKKELEKNANGIKKCEGRIVKENKKANKI